MMKNSQFVDCKLTLVCVCVSVKGYVISRRAYATADHENLFNNGFVFGATQFLLDQWIHRMSVPL